MSHTSKHYSSWKRHRRQKSFNESLCCKLITGEEESTYLDVGAKVDYEPTQRTSWNTRLTVFSLTGSKSELRETRRRKNWVFEQFLNRLKTWGTEFKWSSQLPAFGLNVFLRISGLSGQIRGVHIRPGTRREPISKTRSVLLTWPWGSASCRKCWWLEVRGALQRAPKQRLCHAPSGTPRQGCLYRVREEKWSVNPEGAVD